jgi:hypothetical protein
MDLDAYLNQTAPRPAAAVPDAVPPPSAPDTFWQSLEPVEFLPNGQPVKVTLRRTVIMADVFGASEAPFSAVLSIVFLYLCAHEAASWSAPRIVAPGDIRPLWRAPEQLCEEALTWGDAALNGLLPAEVANPATRIWFWHDATRVTPQKKTAGNGATITTDHSRSAGNSGSGLPPSEMSAAGRPSSMTFPCETSMLPSIANSSAGESPAPPKLTTPSPPPASMPSCAPSGSEN